MSLDYRWPDEIDPSQVEGIAEACDRAAIQVAKAHCHFLADDLMSAAKLLRLLAECEPTQEREDG